jgi:hypothetical protein
MSFRYMANRSLTLVTGDEMLLTYQTLQPLMRKRFILPDDRGVLWDAGAAGHALFAYRAFAHPVPAGSRVVEIRGTRKLPATIEAGCVKAEPLTAYRW